jgi:iron complex outermembrane receptor protein
MSRFLLAASTVALLSAPAFAQDPASDGAFVDEIITTGSPLNTSVDEALTGVSVLTGEELEQALAANIGETLKREPGVSSTFFGAGASRPIIRGQGGDRVRVLTNGVGSIDASSASPDHAVAIEPAQAERIEVVRGASVLRYGSSGAGGVVNIIDGRIPTELPEGGTDAALRLSGSTVDEGVAVAGSIDQAIGENIVVHFDAAWRESSDYDIPGFAETPAFRRLEALEEQEEHGDEDHDDDDHDEEDHDEDEEEAFGTLENSFVESQSFTGGISYIGDRGFLGVALNRFKSTYGLPGGHEHGHEEEEGEEHGDEDHDEEEEGEEEVFIDLESTRFDINAALNLSGAFERLQFAGGYADYSHIEFEGPGEVGTTYSNEGFEGRLELIQAERDGWQAAYGVQIRDRDFSAFGEEAFVPPTDTQQYAAFTFHEKDMGDWHLEGAARIEITDHENTTAGVSRNFTALSVSGGADFHVNDAVRIGGTLFRTERAPATEELFSNGPHLATNQFEVGDPTLGKETATGAEFAIRHRGEGSAVTLNIFYTNYSDYIFERETGEEEEDELPVFEFVAEDADFYGFELAGRFDMYNGPNWTVSTDGVLEFTRAKADENLPRIPPLAILVGLNARKGPLSMRSEIDWVNEQERNAPFELETNGYTLVNASVAYDLTEQVTVRVGVDNLFDEDARQHTSFLKDQVPLPGQNFKASLLARF